MSLEIPIAFRPVSLWQKPGCIVPACDQPAAYEAFPVQGNVSAVVRCCAEEAHKQHAVTLVRAWLSAP